jgi:hypothetical protein
VGWDWAHLVRRPLTSLLYQPRTICDKCGELGGMRIGRGNRRTRRKPTPEPLCSPQIPHNLTWTRTQAAAVGNRRLTAELWSVVSFQLVDDNKEDCREKLISTDWDLFIFYCFNRRRSLGHVMQEDYPKRKVKFNKKLQLTSPEENILLSSKKQTLLSSE